VVLWILFKGLFRVSISGKENIPKTGAAVLVANHASYLDPPMLAVSCDRHISFMAKAGLFKQPILGTLLRIYESFPVNRDKTDLKAFRTAIRRIEEGRLVAIFPEGTRRRMGPKKLGPLEPGAAYLILKSGVPMVPIGLSGTEKVVQNGKRFPRFPRISVTIGKPIICAPKKPDQKTISDLSQEIERSIISLLK
jgi:1-acyl-sn-glycerol-3-phosphate acyltransferase